MKKLFLTLTFIWITSCGIPKFFGGGASSVHSSRSSGDNQVKNGDIGKISTTTEPRDCLGALPCASVSPSPSPTPSPTPIQRYTCDELLNGLSDLGFGWKPTTAWDVNVNLNPDSTTKAKFYSRDFTPGGRVAVCIEFGKEGDISSDENKNRSVTVSASRDFASPDLKESMRIFESFDSLTKNTVINTSITQNPYSTNCPNTIADTQLESTTYGDHTGSHEFSLSKIVFDKQICGPRIRVTINITYDSLTGWDNLSPHLIVLSGSQ